MFIFLWGETGRLLENDRNLLVVWLLTGFWHGASWNFILWGLVLFLLIFLEKLGLGKLFARRPVGRAYLHAVCHSIHMDAVCHNGFIPDRNIFSAPFSVFGSGRGIYLFCGRFSEYAGSYALSLCAGLIFITPVPKNLYNRWKNTPVSALILLIVFWGCVYCMKMGMDDPFLYFRF